MCANDDTNDREEESAGVRGSMHERERKRERDRKREREREGDDHL